MRVTTLVVLLFMSVAGCDLLGDEAERIATAETFELISAPRDTIEYSNPRDGFYHTVIEAKVTFETEVLTKERLENGTVLTYIELEPDTNEWEFYTDEISSNVRKVFETYNIEGLKTDYIGRIAAIRLGKPTLNPQALEVPFRYISSWDLSDEVPEELKTFYDIEDLDPIRIRVVSVDAESLDEAVNYENYEEVARKYQLPLN